MTLEQVYAAIGGDYKGVMERLPSADFVRRFALHTPTSALRNAAGHFE